MHEGKFQCRRPIAQQMRQRFPSSECVEQRAKDSPIKKAEHGVIKLVKSNRRMINIVGQASDEPMAVRDRRNLHQRNSAGEDQIAQQRDMQLQRWTVGKLDGLARTEERADLTKEVIPDSSPHTNIANFQVGSCFTGFQIDEEFSRFSRKRDAIAIDRDPASATRKNAGRLSRLGNESSAAAVMRQAPA